MSTRALLVLIAAFATASCGGGDYEFPTEIQIAGKQVRVAASINRDFSPRIIIGNVIPPTCIDLTVIGMFSATPPPMPAGVTPIDAQIYDGQVLVWSGPIVSSETSVMGNELRAVARGCAPEGFPANHVLTVVFKLSDGATGLILADREVAATESS